MTRVIRLPEYAADWKTAASTMQESASRSALQPLPKTCRKHPSRASRRHSSKSPDLIRSSPVFTRCLLHSITTVPLPNVHARYGIRLRWRRTDNLVMGTRRAAVIRCARRASWRGRNLIAAADRLCQHRGFGDVVAFDSRKPGNDAAISTDAAKREPTIAVTVASFKAANSLTGRQYPESIQRLALKY